MNGYLLCFLLVNHQSINEVINVFKLILLYVGDRLIEIFGKKYISE